MAQDDGVFHTGQWVRRRAGGDRTVVIFVQVATADAIVENPQFDVAGTRFRFGNGFEPEVEETVIDRSAHTLPPRIASYGSRSAHRPLARACSATRPAGKSSAKQFRSRGS